VRAFIRKTKNKGVNMKPIRKNELEHWANLIDRKFEARGAEFNDSLKLKLINSPKTLSVRLRKK
jgi:hypothetical protein